MILRGVKESCGSFKDKKSGEDIDYHNMIIYVTEPLIVRKSSDMGHIGEQVGEYKVRGDDIQDVFGSYDGVESLEMYIGKAVKLYFDKYQNVNGIDFLEE